MKLIRVPKEQRYRAARVVAGRLGRMVVGRGGESCAEASVARALWTALREDGREDLTAAIAAARGAWAGGTERNLVELIMLILRGERVPDHVLIEGDWKP